eukprot:scaffold3422_cov298-Prasinococcus_capsulatus_cf.AAC.7
MRACGHARFPCVLAGSLACPFACLLACWLAAHPPSEAPRRVRWQRPPAPLRTVVVTAAVVRVVAASAQQDTRAGRAAARPAAVLAGEEGARGLATGAPTPTCDAPTHAQRARPATARPVGTWRCPSRPAARRACRTPVVAWGCCAPPPAAGAMATASRLRQWMRRHRTKLVLGVMAGGAAAVAGYHLWYEYEEERR